jgi:hypothetical protein
MRTGQVGGIILRHIGPCSVIDLTWARFFSGGEGRGGEGLVLSCLIHASCWADAPRWGGRAAALLARCPPPTTSNLDLLSVRCRSSPEFPFRFIWVLGWKIPKCLGAAIALSLDLKPKGLKSVLYARNCKPVVLSQILDSPDAKILGCLFNSDDVFKLQQRQ